MDMILRRWQRQLLICAVSLVFSLPGYAADAQSARSGLAQALEQAWRLHPQAAALEAREEARGGPPYLIDAGHWATESLWLAHVERDLIGELGVALDSDQDAQVDTSISQLCTDPWTFVVD